MGGGAWPFLVGGAICLVNSDNERDSSLLNRLAVYTAVLPLGWPSGVVISSLWFHGGALPSFSWRILQGRNAVAP